MTKANRLIYMLLVIQLAIIVFFIFKNTSLTKQRKMMNQEIDKLKSEMRSKLPVKECNLTSTNNQLETEEKNKNSEPTKEEFLRSFPKKNDDVVLVKSKNGIDLSSVEYRKKIFNEEETDIEWAVEYEEQINTMLNSSENLSEMGFVHLECRTSGCLLILARSARGAFTDYNIFTDELRKQEWRKKSNGVVSFSFGKKNEEEYIEFFIAK